MPTSANFAITAKRLGVVATATSFLFGGIAVGAGSAEAASVSGLGFKTVSAPNTVASNKTFTVKCQLHPAGYKSAKLFEKGVGTIAERRMRGKNCNFRVALSSKGKHKLRVKTYSVQNRLTSKWITITVS